MVVAPGRRRCGAATSTTPADVPPRVAFAIGRAVGPAVVRNRLRRRLRALAAERARAGDVARCSRHGSLLVGARPAAAERSFEELGVEVTDHAAHRAPVAGSRHERPPP